jgi:hypothetical protein
MEDSKQNSPQSATSPTELDPALVSVLQDLPGVTGNRYHIDLGTQITEPQALALVYRLKTWANSYQWWVGDLSLGLLRLGYQEAYQMLPGTLGLTHSRLKQIKMAVAAFPKHFRHPKVFFCAHEAVLAAGWPTSKAPEEIRDSWLSNIAWPLLLQAADEGWSVSGMKEAIRNAGYRKPEKQSPPSLAGFKPVTAEFRKISEKLAALHGTPNPSPKAVMKMEFMEADAKELTACLLAKYAEGRRELAPPDQSPRLEEGACIASSEQNSIAALLKAGLLRVKGGEDLNKVARDLAIKPKQLVDFRYTAALEELVRGVPFGEVCTEYRLAYPALQLRLKALGPRTRSIRKGKPAEEHRG